jgi:hypothetical protein
MLEIQSVYLPNRKATNKARERESAASAEAPMKLAKSKGSNLAS